MPSLYSTDSSVLLYCMYACMVYDILYVFLKKKSILRPYLVEFFWGARGWDLGVGRVFFWLKMRIIPPQNAKLSGLNPNGKSYDNGIELTQHFHVDTI